MKIFINIILLISMAIIIDFTLRPVSNIYQAKRICSSFLLLCIINLLLNLNVNFNPKRHEK
jgi:predicted PurR-regulated permease PerM